MNKSIKSLGSCGILFSSLDMFHKTKHFIETFSIYTPKTKRHILKQLKTFNLFNFHFLLIYFCFWSQNGVISYKLPVTCLNCLLFSLNALRARCRSCSHSLVFFSSNISTVQYNTIRYVLQVQNTTDQPTNRLRTTS